MIEDVEVNNCYIAFPVAEISTTMPENAWDEMNNNICASASIFSVGNKDHDRDEEF